MVIRVLILLTCLFALVMTVVYGMRLPIDGLLLFLGVLVPTIMGLFAHYRYVGRLRTRGNTKAALRHLRFWFLLLPAEAYQQLRIQILIEADDPRAASSAIERAEKKGLSSSFVRAFRADLHRRRGAFRDAETQLQKGLDETPPGLIRAGLLTQLSRLYIHHMPTKSNLKQVGFLLDEARQLTPQSPHSELIDAVQGEWLLARKQFDKASTLLRKSLESLLDTPLAKDQRPPKRSLGQRIGSFLAQLTYSQRDEHQFPFFAELCLSLARAYDALKQPKETALALETGLSLCQQPYVAEPLRELQRSLRVAACKS